MFEKLSNYASKKPEIYEISTSKFWDDEHISKGMLEAHLNPEWDAATRNHNFITKSVEWIASIANPVQYPELLDLGCGPGLYAERFHKRGYHVTGIDYSRRSIDYAVSNAKINDITITYKYQNYLDITYQEEFDVITLIYCDFSVMSDRDRSRLLNSIYQALKPNGKFILDVFTPIQYKDRKETKDWYFDEAGFWSDKAHICLNSFYRYDEHNTMLEQTVVITKEAIHCYNLWDHTFTKEELEEDLCKAGFTSVDFYGDVAGDVYQPDGNLMCAVAKKKG
jgi:2-polyprenyl-3-methyl-5-hydroxy-6-metoxy-1,4-benzoquinol methylase